MPDLRFRVQIAHVPDRIGRCRECRDGTRWPCELSQIATEAERLGAGWPVAAPADRWGWG